MSQQTAAPPRTPLSTGRAPRTPASRSAQRPHRKEQDKISAILDTIREQGWSLAEFLYRLFRLEDNRGKPVSRTSQHESMVTSLLNGVSSPTFGTILCLIFDNAVDTKYASGDKTASGRVFEPKLSPAEIKHAQLAMTTWAVNLVTDIIREEAKVMIGPDAGLRLRATAKEGSVHQKDIATWEKVDSFSLRTIQTTAERSAPTMWHLLNAYTNRQYSSPGRVTAVRKYRPHNLVCIQAIGSLTFGCSEHASLYPMCRGFWYFAVKAHQSIYRVESRLAQSVSYETVRRHFSIVGDNIQAYAKQRDHRIGRESRMLKGFAGTAVELHDYEPEAFDLQELKRRRALMERKQLTADMILNDIDWDHLDAVGMMHFLRALVEFVPALSRYRQEVQKLLQTRLRKIQIPLNHRSNIIPLGSNSADEMTVQGMKEAVVDFLDAQMGISDEEKLANRICIFSGDGKTFDQLIKVMKYLVSEKSDLSSLRCVVPMLELWHTKWTDLSRVMRQHWGEGCKDDPSTLAHLAELAECPVPSDLRKVDFNSGAHTVDLCLDAHLLNCWENLFQTKDLVQHFDKLDKEKNLPPLDSLCRSAEILARRHATTAAYERARSNDTAATTHIDTVPRGSPWQPKKPSVSQNPRAETAAATVSEDDLMEIDEDDALSDLSEPAEANKGKADITLANATLFMRNGILWREVCEAIATGDTGRVWEVLKFWTFTFAGSGNPYYSQYLLELYCNFKWEFSPALRHLVFMNWLINQYGEAGRFIEMDLMQEHFNFWLEDMAQHKGKEFDEPFYRYILAMNVHHFLRLKDEMEEIVSLKARSKKHCEPHLRNELRVLMERLRAEEVNQRRPGRNEGFEAIDDFKLGLDTLKKDKIKNFITRTTSHLDILGEHGQNLADLNAGDPKDDWEGAGRDELPERSTRAAPPPQMMMVDGELCTSEST
ncbi:hypothetical protein PLICRDRAFT_115567 [Plicaturopsis crispa FD-325 SS-3]|nr:hypothetical protein PLICRDRAFT_115567 [Plicaturopsis crispa FD-325 SS-3]